MSEGDDTDESPAPDATPGESSAPDEEPTGVPSSEDEPATPSDPGGEEMGASPDDAATPPRDETATRRTIAPRVRLVWAIPVVVTAIVILLGGSAAANSVPLLPVWVAPVGGFAVLVVGLLWVEARYRVWAFEVRADALYLERGVVTHVRTIAPYVRIQHVDTQRGPVERWLGLSTLVVYTAGSRGADVSIPGLEPDEARELQSRVKQLAIEAEGGDAV